MTKGRIEQLKGVWELVFIAWTMFVIGAMCTSKATWDVLLVMVVVEVMLIVGGHWIADQDRRYR